MLIYRTLNSQITMAPSKPRLLYFSNLALSPDIPRSSLQGQHNTTQEYSIITVGLVPIQMWEGNYLNTYKYDISLV